jgi:hypothetical protein
MLSSFFKLTALNGMVCCWHAVVLPVCLVQVKHDPSSPSQQLLAKRR